jgi:hypothetical protein
MIGEAVKNDISLFKSARREGTLPSVVGGEAAVRIIYRTGL